MWVKCQIQHTQKSSTITIPTMIPNDNITDISVDKLVASVDHGNTRDPDLLLSIRLPKCSPTNGQPSHPA